ncbi:MAG: SOS response-associated peptidase [Longimicrobiales bacterium]
MCGRYTLTEDVDAIAEVFSADVEGIRAVHEPRYNIAPTQYAPAIIAGDEGLRAGLLRWGLVPHWAKDLSQGGRMINARSETVSSKPAFRESFLSRRCLIPADGFYEWEAQGSVKQPYWIHRPDEALFGFAGLWATWKAPDDTKHHTFSILTRAAPRSLTWLHDRVPVILPADAWTDWLAKGTAAEVLTGLIDDGKTPSLRTHPVSRRVNKADSDFADCTDEIDLDDVDNGERGAGGSGQQISLF